MTQGVIVKGVGGFYYVATAQGQYECRARGKFRHQRITPSVGDWVKISVLDEEAKKGSLDEILPRKNALLRPRVVNVDQAVIVFAAKSPDPNVDLLNRFLLLAEEQKLQIVLCINKIDLDAEGGYHALATLYRQVGYPVLPVSPQTGEGVEALRQYLKGKITVFAGPSGVGKSSLLNALKPELHLTTGTISKKIERGRHTTRHAELMPLDEQSYIVDSPGFTSLSLEQVRPENLAELFREFRPYLGGCYYRTCRHLKEPDCAVKAHVGKEIPPERYARYEALYQELTEFWERKNKK